MRAVQQGKNVVLLIFPEQLNLVETLQCGQCFRFTEEEDGGFRGIAFGREIHMAQRDGKIVFFDTSLAEYEKIWRSFFDLNTDYDRIKARLTTDPIMEKAIRYCPGVRILRQEPFEALISFLISQNNNIPRIKGCIDRLCRRFGEQIGKETYAFPSAEKMASASCSDYTDLGLGYRDEYVYQCASLVASGKLDLEKIKTLPLPEARLALLGVLGIGPKVAECVLLYGFHRLEAFPIDTWMKKALREFYSNGFPSGFADIAGIAQQYLFHYIRTCPACRK